MRSWSLCSSHLCPTPCPTRPPCRLARAVFFTAAQPLRGTGPADGGEHWDIAALGGGNAPA